MLSKIFFKSLILTNLCVLLVGVVETQAHTFVSNIEYYSPGGLRNALDLYTPDGGVNETLPTLMFIHSGGWRSGDKTMNTEMHQMLTDVGYSVVSCNYTLSTQVSPSFPQAVHDVKAVIKWIRTTGVSQYNLSPEIVPFGTSAGGHLSMMLQTTGGMDYFEPLPPPQGGYEVQGAISFWGPSDLVVFATELGYGEDPRLVDFLGVPYSEETADLWALASPITHLDANDPPLSIFHGTRDASVPFEQSPAMYKASKKTGVLTWFFPFNGTHGFSYDIGKRPGGVLRMQQIIPAMIALDITSNTPLTEIKFSQGKPISGDIQNLIGSDSQHLRCQSQQSGGDNTQIVSLTVMAETGNQDASALHIAVETKLNIPNGTLTLLMKNYDSNTFIKIGSFQMGIKETIHKFVLNDFNSYRNKFGDIMLQLVYSSNTAANLMQLEVEIDQVHFDAY